MFQNLSGFEKVCYLFFCEYCREKHCEMVVTTDTLSPTYTLPTTMRAGQVQDYGDIDTQVSVQDGVAVPQLSKLSARQRKNQMIVQTHAVSLAPGDVRVLSGKTKEIQGPPALPYIPAGDCSGIVVQLPDNAPSNLPFRIGDRVAVRFEAKNYDAMAEYALVNSIVACKVPDDLSSEEAAALASAAPATLMARSIQPGERVLVMGASGGVGSHLCQMLHLKGASYIAGVSSSPERLLQPPISCEAAIDYTKEDVFAMEKYRKEPFDVIFDLAGGGYQQLQSNLQQDQPLIVKTGSMGGRFITTVPPIGPKFEGHSIWQLLNVFLFPTLWKALTSRVWYRKNLPKYSFALALDADRAHLQETLELASSRKLTAVIDPKGPFPFTSEGLRNAYHLQESRHPHGKVIVRVKSEK